MTLVIAIECTDGTLVATDSRLSYGEDYPLMREVPSKIDIFGNKFTLTIVGAVGTAGKAVNRIRSEFQRQNIESSTAFFELCEDACFDVTKRYKERIDLATALTDEDLSFDIVASSKDGISAITMEGIAEPVQGYACFGSSELYGEYIVKQMYKKQATLDQATRWALYALKQASLIDPAVGGPFHVAFATESGVRILTPEELMKIEQEISGESPEFQRDLYQLMDSIVDLRRTINQVVSQRQGAPLFNQKEAEIWTLARPVVSEEQFTNNILALGILIDEMTPPSTEKAQKSLEALETWLNSLTRSKLETRSIIGRLWEIRTLRNTSFPVHSNDIEFISVVAKWGLTFPPDWARLYSCAIRHYLSTLEKLKTLLLQTPPEKGAAILESAA